MKKGLIMTVWVLLLCCLFGFTAYADTVPIPPEAECGMYYDEDGTVYFSPSCRGICTHIPKVGDKYVDAEGNIIAEVEMISPCYSEGKIVGYAEIVDYCR